MEKRAFVVVGLIAAIGVFGIVETLEAQPAGSQRLRRLGGRTFWVQVDQVDGPMSFQNCYQFFPDQSWEETLNPTMGGWTQDSNGAKTSYSVDAVVFGVLPLHQVGEVSPAGGRGVLQLVATSTVTIPFTDPPTILTYISVGSEIDPGAAALCPAS